MKSGRLFTAERGRAFTLSVHELLQATAVDLRDQQVGVCIKREHVREVELAGGVTFLAEAMHDASGLV